jgi:PAS domain S-box-containing protein
LLDRAIEEGFEGTDETVNSRGLKSLTTFRRLTSKPWIIGANFPISEAYAPTRSMRTPFWLGTIFMVCMSGIGGHLLTRRFMAPILALAQKATELTANPNALQRLEICTGTEVDVLVAAFNKLLAENERRQAEQQHQFSFLQTLMDTIPSPIFYKDATGHYLGCNKGFEQVVGLPEQELVGKTVYDIAPREKALVYEEADRALLAAGGTQVYEATVCYADGTEHEVLFYKAVLTSGDDQAIGIVGTYLDITERKAAEKALLGQKEFSERLLHHATVAAFVIDTHHRTIIWNQACSALTGVPASEVLGMSNHWRGFYVEQRPCLADLVLDQAFDQAAKHYATLRKSPYSEDGLQAEGWFQLAGQQRYMLFTAAPIRNADGRVVAALETLEDITERKEREDELSAIAQAVSIASGEGFFASVAHYIAKTLGTDYVLIGSFDDQNLETVRTLAVATQGGFAPNFTYNLAGTPCAEVLKGDICCFPEQVSSLFPQDTLLQKMEIEGYVGMPLLGTGHVPLGILVALHRTPINDSKRVRALLKIFASRTTAELQRQQDEVWLRKLSHAVAQSPVSVVITDTDGRIEFVNPKFSTVTGYSADEVVGETPSILKSGETPAKVYAELWATIREGRVWEGVFHNRRKDGELYWERASIGPIKNDQGVITNFIGIKEDITEQKRLEGALRHAHKMEAVGQLAGGVAHDFNNILTAVIGYASILEIHAGEDRQRLAAAQQIIKAGERGAGLTKSLLAFSRMQAVNVRPIDLNEIVTNGEKLLSRLLKESITLNISLATEPLIVTVDCLEIEQVLMNLVTNARDAMPLRGSISLTTGRAVMDQQFVRDLGYGVPGNYAVLCVADDGEGMDQQTADKIFEPFFTTKEVGRGTGLGLAIVYNIIKSHNGNVICTSSPGAGTSFAIYLPLAAESIPVPAAVINSATITGSELILLVEDDPEIRGLLRQYLEEFGYAVEIAGDGEEALAQFSARREEISLVILDAGLPRMSGPDALVAMRRQRPDLKAIIISGYAQNTCTIAEEGERTRFLAKPIGPEDLVRAVREELDQ